MSGRHGKQENLHTSRVEFTPLVRVHVFYYAPLTKNYAPMHKYYFLLLRLHTIGVEFTPLVRVHVFYYAPLTKNYAPMHKY